MVLELIEVFFSRYPCVPVLIPGAVKIICPNAQSLPLKGSENSSRNFLRWTLVAILPDYYLDPNIVPSFRISSVPVVLVGIYERVSCFLLPWLCGGVVPASSGDLPEVSVPILL